MKHGAKPLNLDPTKLFRLCAGQGVLPLVQQAIEMKQVNPILYKLIVPTSLTKKQIIRHQ